MKLKVMKTNAIKNPIAPSPGFAKKGLSEYKLDLAGLCEFGCRYCSSNHGNYLRIRKKKFADQAEALFGERLTPAENPELSIAWPDLIERLEAQLKKKPKSWGKDKTLVVSMLTDGFSPSLVKDGIILKALELVLEKTSFRIRVLTKNAIIGRPEWVDLFVKHPGRFVCGLSFGTLDRLLAYHVERLTPAPHARLKALHRLQEAGVPTFGMLCPMFPDILEGTQLEELVNKIQPELLEHVWAEPYNNRMNWEQVRAGYEEGSTGYTWMTEVYANKNKAAWSRYATDLYLRLRAMAEAGGWLPKLRYLLYEKDITKEDADRLPDLKGILLQSKPGPDGLSKNPHIRQLQLDSNLQPCG